MWGVCLEPERRVIRGGCRSGASARWNAERWEKLQWERRATCSMNRSICATGMLFQHCHREQVAMRCMFGAKGDGNSLLVLEWCRFNMGY